MIGTCSPVRLLSTLVLAGILLLPLSAAAGVIEIRNYVVSIGLRADYFFGKLLTPGEFDTEQSYMKAKQYLGPTALARDEAFGPGGRADVFLTFEDSDAVGDNRSDPADAGDPHAEDMIFLDTDEDSWNGRLYLAGFAGIEDGLYDNLGGSFERLVAVPEPAGVALLGLGLAGLWTLGRRR